MDDQRLRGGLPITDGVMIRAIQQLCGAAWLESCVTKTQSEFAKKGVFAWKMLDTNVLLDVAPAPEPYRGEWCYRLKTTHITPTGEVHVCEFYLPQSDIPLSR
jgi:hypothetical protein